MQIDYKGKKKPRIRMLTSCFGWDRWDEFNIQMEDETGLYFDDIYDRWSTVDKKDEGKEFVYVRKVKDIQK